MKFKADVRDENWNPHELIIDAPTRNKAIEKLKADGYFIIRSVEKCEVENVILAFAIDNFSIVASISILFISFLLPFFSASSTKEMIVKEFVCVITGIFTFLFYGGLSALIKKDYEQIKLSIWVGIVFMFLASIGSSLPSSSDNDYECNQSGQFATDC